MQESPKRVRAPPAGVRGADLATSSAMMIRFDAASLTCRVAPSRRVGNREEGGGLASKATRPLLARPGIAQRERRGRGGRVRHLADALQRLEADPICRVLDPVHRLPHPAPRQP